ncbi:ABC transporter permease [Aureimonas jatrophae]|uniref:Osmoprotectant transport system permease protein n=1 Tax=Aureimonas jatrophae TaxID=1166073 RepID=A0A1H0J502_9HYPH|nr:ABC transporter permease [Aureimonas jatrophae]MBB3951589.1 osmoprotectant transport system permease protein [Aureimonas jatrophae]SDO38838.1 osmoprotectant transport system permease protein [Aureimonas jatrophae]
MSRRIDLLGLVLSASSAVALLALPFAILRANRIVPGVGKPMLEALSPGFAGTLAVVVAACVGISALSQNRWLRLAAAAGSLAALVIALGAAPGHLLDPTSPNRYARVAPGSGFWVAFCTLSLLLTDALTRLRPSPALRLAALASACLLVALLLLSGWLDGLSVFREYDTRADSFWREARHHLTLVLGSLAAACVAGIPLGILCHRVAALRRPILGVLDVVQTIPAIALFGLLIAPLAYVAAHMPGAAALGFGGIGTAPAFVALFLYSLLPMTANTVAGLAGVPAEAEDAARGAGMTARQRLFHVGLPLAFPVILAGVRIVLVQNVGLATVAALIGGGGLGVFVFQGIGQTAADLVLLGAIPTVALAFGCAVLLDALIDLSRRERSLAA